jgi:hypothetical protein
MRARTALIRPSLELTESKPREGEPATRLGPSESEGSRANRLQGESEENARRHLTSEVSPRLDWARAKRGIAGERSRPAPQPARRRSTRVKAAVILAALFFSARADAFTFRLLKQPLRLDITESLFSSYHGDLGDLKVEHDRFGRATNPRFFDLLNRLNVDVAWKNWRLATRFDTAVYFDTPKGSCGPENITPAPLLSRFCQNYFYLEKISLEYTSRQVDATLGDFYVSFGRGLVLSIRKLDELGIDTTVQGGKVVFHEGNLGATFVLGGSNIQNIDEATGRYADDPHDMIAGARVEYRIADKVIVGLHEAGGLMAKNLTPNQHDPDSMFMYGGTIEAPRATRWLSLYLEGAGQSLSSADKRYTGYALYGAATGYFGPFSLLLEVKHYSEFRRWASSVNPSFDEFKPVAYNQPPTAERLQTELTAPIYDVTGPRLRVDWRIRSWALIYASYAYFQDRGLPGTGLLGYHDPYVGAEFRWSDGRSHFFPSGGYRMELCADENPVCLGETPGGKGEFQHIGHVEWDFTQFLPHGLSLESQGFVLIRRGDNTTTVDNMGNLHYPGWVEGDWYLAFKWTPHLVGTLGWEWTTRPSPNVNQHYFNGALQWNITTASSIRLFAGGTRGGLKCISGICRTFPPFTGVRLEVVVRL